MKLTTKRDRWYFWRELFSYMIPMILIVGTVDVFFNFMQCPLHPEYSAPCSIIWINAAGYGFFLVITIIFAIFSARKLKKVKKRIEVEFMKAANHTENKVETVKKVVENAEENMEESVNSGEIKKVKELKPKKVITKSTKKESTKKISKKDTNKADGKKLKKEKTSTKKRATRK